MHTLDNRRLTPCYLRKSSSYNPIYKNCYSKRLEENLRSAGLLDKYEGYVKHEKSAGSHPGFILRNDDSQKVVYFKTEVNADHQALVLAILGHFIKAPEVKLLPTDIKVNASINCKASPQHLTHAIESQGLDRSYEKNGYLKSKTFFTCSNLRWIKTNNADYKAVVAGLEKDEKLAVSLAKLKLLISIFRLSDYENANSGFLKTVTSDGATYYKAALVDCDIGEKLYYASSPQLSIDQIEVSDLTENLIKDLSFCRDIWRKAMQEIMRPKVKELDSQDGYLKVQHGKLSDFASVLKTTFDDYTQTYDKEYLEEYSKHLVFRCTELFKIIEDDKLWERI